jgi:hypothetical protein
MKDSRQSVGTMSPLLYAANALMKGLLFAGLVAISGGCGDATRAVAPPSLPPVKVEPVVERDVPISVEYVGTLVGTSTRRSAPG